MYVTLQNDQLVVEARVDPNDIDNAKAGLKAKIQFIAFKTKKAPKLTGEVLSASASILQYEVSGGNIFIVRIEINKDEVNHIKAKNLSISGHASSNIYCYWNKIVV